MVYKAVTGSTVYWSGGEWGEERGGTVREGLLAHATGCHSKHPCITWDSPLAVKPPLTLPHLFWTKVWARSPAQICDWTWRRGGDTVPLGHRAFVFHPNVLKTYCNLILLGQSLANWFLHAGFPWELLRDTIYCKKFFQWQQQEPCFMIATLNPTPGQGMLMNFPRPCAWLSKIMLLSAPLPDFSELVKDLGYLLKDSCELSFMEYIIFHRCLLWSDPRHAPDLGSSWDNTNHKRQLVSQRH